MFHYRMITSAFSTQGSKVASYNRHLGRISHFIFLRESRFYGSGVLSRKCETLRCENSTLAMICLLLLINGVDVTILWAGLAKRSEEISCSQNIAAARDFYDARRTFYASSYENLVEKSARQTRLCPNYT